jgi:two-component system response regulator FimZ (fimbrial Z protein)/two-component system response regulator EvgA
MRKKVLLVDDHPAMLWALKSMIQAQAHFEVVGEASNGEACLEISKKIQPDIIVLDIDMPKIDGLDVIRRLSIQAPDIRILVVSSLDAKIYGNRVRSTGGHGFINKTANSDIIMAACLAVSQGYTFFQTAQDGKAPDSDEEKISSFSPREFQVLKYLASGFSNSDISEFLHISSKTVSTYKHRLYKKIGVKNIADLIAFCKMNKITDA